MSAFSSGSPAPALPADDSLFSTANLTRAARKNLPLVLLCVVVTCALAAFWSLSQTRVYQSESMLRIDPDPPKPLGHRVELLQASNGGYWNRREFYESEFRIMKSMRVAVAVVRALNLNNDPGFAGTKPGQLFKPLSVVDAGELLVSRIVVQPIKDSSLAVLKYEDTDPDRAQRILSAIVRTYLAQNLENATTMSSSALDWLNTQLEDLQKKLEKSEFAIKEFREKNNVLSISLEDRHNILSSQLEAISKDLTALTSKSAEQSARVTELRKINSNDPTQAGAIELLSSVVLSNLRSAYNDQVQKVNELLVTLDEGNPRVIAARARIKETAAAIKKEIDNIKLAAEGDLRRVNQQIGSLKKSEEVLQKQAHELQAFEIPYNQLLRNKTNNEKIYGLVMERARETDLTRMMNFNNIRVIDEATRPKLPIRPNKPMNLMVGAGAGLLLGLLLSVMRDLSDRSVRTPEDVESWFGQTCLGLVPQMKDAPKRRKTDASLAKRDLIVHHEPESSIAEAMRSIRTNLTFMSPDQPYRKLLVTSAIPEEGKTSVACSLAITLAQSGQRVVLVDTDLRRPRVHRAFGVTNDLGVTMAISAQATVEECLQETDIHNLMVLTSGPVPPNPAELLQSERFGRLLDTLATQFDRVILDSPPLLPVTDATIISKQVDGTIVVIRTHRTHRAAVRQALRQLFDVKAHIVGLILNAVDLNRRDYREYGTYYRYGKYYRRGSEAA